MSGWEILPIVTPISFARWAVSSSMITGPPDPRPALISRPTFAWRGPPRDTWAITVRGRTIWTAPCNASPRMPSSSGARCSSAMNAPAAKTNPLTQRAQRGPRPPLHAAVCLVRGPKAAPRLVLARSSRSPRLRLARHANGVALGLAPWFVRHPARAAARRGCRRRRPRRSGLAVRLGGVPYLDGQRAVAAYPLTRDWRLADDEAVNRHRVRRQPDRGYVQAESAGHLHAHAVEQPRDIRHDHPGMPIRIRLQ